MAFIHLPQRWSRQPQGAVGVNANSDFARGLVRVLLPPTPCDLALNTPIVFGNEIKVGSDSGYTCFYHPSANGTNGINIPSFDVADGASVLLLQRRFSTAYNGWFYLGTADGDHITFGGLVYAGPFYNARWVNGVPPQIDITKAHTFACAVKTGSQIALLNDKIIKQSTLTATPATTATLRLLMSIVSGYSFNGALYLALFWNRALSYDELIYISKNPFQIFKPLNRVIYFPVSSGLTSVQQDSFVRWNIIQAIHNDAQLKWDVRIAVENDTLIKWNVLTGVLADTELSWNTLTSAQNALELKWHLLEHITADVSIYWNILTSAQQDAVTAWNALSAIHTDCAVRWDNLTAAQQSVLLEWNLATAAQSDICIQWDTLAHAITDALLQWNILSEVFSASNDAVLRWDSLTTAQQSALMRWNLLSAVEKALTTRWDILKALDVSVTTRWDIANAVATELTARWNLATTTFADTTLTWDTLAISENAIELRWNIGDNSVTPPIRIFLVRGENRVFTVAGSNRSF